MYDIAIIGAGPAGSTLARLLHPRYRSILIDRRNLENPDDLRFQKVCGGLLAPDAQKEICRQGLGLPKDVLVSPQLFGVHTMDQKGRQQLYQRHYFNLDRQAFDRWLYSLVPDRVHRRLGNPLQSVEKHGANGYSLKFRGGEEIQARMVVGADGGESILRRRLFPLKTIPRYTAVQQSFRLHRPISQYGALFDPSITDFYGWSISKGSELILGAALREGKGLMERFETFRDPFLSRIASVGELLETHSAPILRPLGFRHLCLGSSDSFLIGEAAGWISPSSAEGISYAMKSARYLAGALDPGPKGGQRRYSWACGSLRRNLIGKWLKSPGMYWSWLRAMVLKSGVGAI